MIIWVSYEGKDGRHHFGNQSQDWKFPLIMVLTGIITLFCSRKKCRVDQRLLQCFFLFLFFFGGGGLGHPVLNINKGVGGGIV